MKKRFLSCVLACSILLCLVNTTAFAEAWNFNEIAYKDVDEMVDDCVNYSNVVSALESSASTLSTYAGTLSTKLTSLDTSSTDYQSTSYQLSLVKSEILQINVTVELLKQSMGEKDTALETTQIAAKTLFITYNSLRDQISELERKLAVFYENEDVLEQQYKWGLISSLQLEKTKTQGTSIQANIETMQSQLTAIKRSFNTLLGRDYDHALGIHSLPFSELDNISKCDFSDDLDDALGEYSGDTSGSAYSNTDYDAEKGTFAASFRKLYDAMNDKNTLLSNEENTLTVEQESFNASQKQYNAGLISKLAFINAHDSLDTETAKVNAAKTDLFSAYEQYQWAIQYGIISGS